MTFQEFVKTTGELPTTGRTAKGDLITTEVSKTKLGYLYVVWCGSIANPHNYMLDYATGSTEEKAKETLIKKIIKV